MSERTPKRPRPHVTFGTKVVCTEEEGKRLYEKAVRLDNGTAMVVQNTLYAIEDGAHKGRNLLDVVVRLIGHMTPEQRLGLTERLPDLLTEAVSNGATQTKAG